MNRAGRAADSLVFLHQFVLTGAPGGNHLVQVLRGRAHGFELCLAAAFLRRNVKAERLAVPRDGQRRAGFEVTCQFLPEFTDPDFDRLHIVYPLYTLYHVLP